MPFSLRLLNQGRGGENTAGADLYGLRGGGSLKKTVRLNTTAQALRPCGHVPAECLRSRFAFSLAALAHFISVYHFKAAVSGTGKAQPCMILTPPSHAVWRAFRLLLYEIRFYTSVSLSVPFSLRLHN